MLAVLTLLPGRRVANPGFPYCLVLLSMLRVRSILEGSDGEAEVAKVRGATPQIHYITCHFPCLPVVNKVLRF